MKLAALTYVDTRTDSSGASLLSFRPHRPFAYRAGQFGLWIVHGAVRPFTIASAPSEEFIQLGTRLHRKSRIKRALSSLHAGDTVRLVGPFGKIAPPDDGRPVVYVAQGIGITPARALIRERPHRHQTLIHVGSPDFRAELEPLVDTAVYPADRDDCTRALSAAAADADDAHYVVAGSTTFVNSTSQALRNLGVAPDRIQADGFIGLTELIDDRAAAPRHGDPLRVHGGVR
jgi:ferredoxin-NADP reductase